MLLFKSDLGSFFKVTGFYSSAKNVNDYMATSSNDGVIGEIQVDSKPIIVVADFTEVKPGTVSSATGNHVVDDTGEAFSIENVSEDKFFVAQKR